MTKPVNLLAWSLPGTGKEKTVLECGETLKWPALLKLPCQNGIFCSSKLQKGTSWTWKGLWKDLTLLCQVGFESFSPVESQRMDINLDVILTDTIDGSHYALGSVPNTSLTYLPRQWPRRWWLLSYIHMCTENYREVSLTQVAWLGGLDPNLSVSKANCCCWLLSRASAQQGRMRLKEPCSFSFCWVCASIW